MSSPQVFRGVRVTRSLVLYVCFVDCCLSFFFWPLCCLSFFDLWILITPLVSCGHCVVCPSSIYGFWFPFLVSCGHCVVCPSSIYGFWLTLWYLLTIVLSVLLRFTDSDYPFGIFWPLCCLSFFDLRILITPLVSSNSSFITYFIWLVYCLTLIYNYPSYIEKPIAYNQQIKQKRHHWDGPTDRYIGVIVELIIR